MSVAYPGERVYVLWAAVTPQVKLILMLGQTM